jgi:two-component sensor histidine kinase
VRLREGAAETFALAIHELTTNALKYGALSLPKGRLSVSWRVLNTHAGAKLSLTWKEEGVPLVNLDPSRNGFGRELIEQGLPYELGASTSLDFRAGGLHASIEAPLNEKTALLESSEDPL